MRSPSASPTESTQDRLKRIAAEYAVGFIRSGMRIGLGSGSTAYFATCRIGELISQGTLTGVLAFPTSSDVRALAEKLKIPLTDDSMPENLDITIDGADEIDRQMNLIKGGGGALFREKIVAQASSREIIAVDDSKISPSLGIHHSLPVEVSPFGWRSQMRFLESLGARARVRLTSDGTQFVSDSGNMIFDCDFGPIADPSRLASLLSERAGIVEHGLFVQLATDVVIASTTGVRHLQRKGSTITETIPER